MISIGILGGAQAVEKIEKLLDDGGPSSGGMISCCRQGRRKSGRTKQQ
jgi:hypothetical protein